MFLLRFPPLFQLILIAVVGHIALTGARITTSLYALSLHATAFQVGLLIALFALLPMLFAVAIGRLVDRIGIVRPIVCGGVVMMLGCLLPFCLPGLGTLYVAAALIGTGFSGLHVASLHAVGAMSTAANRSSHFSWLGTGYSVSSFTGPVLAGFVIDHAGSADGAGISSVGIGISSVGTGIGASHVMAYLVLAVFPLIASVLVARGPLARLPMPPPAPPAAGSAFGLLPFMASAGALAGLSILLGLAMGSSQPNMLALLHLNAPAGRAGEAIGIRVTISNGSQVVLPLAFGAAGATVGLVPVFFCTGLLIATGVPLAWRQIAPSIPVETDRP